ncbi:MAG: hypothetical protein K2Y21_03755 [Phycisphaerales bacterium]|nr:hypothetical protein [Phycisphaerales bacterium]
MLKEFAFTPQVFDPNAAPNDPRWREYIQAIGVRLFTQPATPVIVAGLHATDSGCTWEHTARTIVEAIEDQNLRLIAQQLLTRVVDVLARRPPCCDWPGEEELGWGKEAADSHAQQPLDLVVARDVRNVPQLTPTVALADALSPGFWAVLQQEEPVPASLAQDVARLRSILVHSECIVISAPYASTTDFAFECIRQAMQRPSGFRTPLIHVHQSLSAEGNPVTRADWLRRRLAGIAGHAIVKWWFWPDASMYRERVVLGGRLANLGGGKTKFAVRSGVAMTHVWGEGNPSDAEPATSTLLSPSQAKRHADALDKRATDLGLSPVQL